MFGERERRQIKWILEELKCRRESILKDLSFDLSSVKFFFDSGYFDSVEDPLEKTSKEISISTIFELPGTLIPVFKVKINGVIYVTTLNLKKAVGTFGVGGENVVSKEDLILIAQIFDEPEKLFTPTYTNENLVPISLGGYKNGEPATPPEGLNFQEAMDKFLFPDIKPEINSFSATPQPLYNQPVNYDINLTWDISIETVGASIDTVTLDYRRGSDSWDNTSLTDNTSATHTITVLDNRDITYRLKVVDTMGNEKTSTFNRTVQNYQKPSIDVKVNNKNSDTLERGSDVTVTGTIDRNRQYVPLSSWSLKMSTNDGAFTEVLNNTDDGSPDISAETNISITHSFVNGNSFNKVEFRLDVTDIETTNSSAIRVVNYKDYSYFGVSTLDTFNISLFGSLTEVKNLNTKGYTPSPFASTIPVGSYIWYLYPTSYGDLEDLLLGPSPIGLGGLIIDTNKTFTNSNGVNVSYYAVRSSDDGAYQEGQQITFI